MDDVMMGPGVHESAAEASLDADRAGEAQVRALLAIASAINRLAAAVEDYAQRF